MKYMLLIYSDEAAWKNQEREDCCAESTQLIHQLQVEGRDLHSSPLHSVVTATSVRVRDGKRLLTDGPFAETYEQLGGYFLVNAKELDEAIAISERIPSDRKGTVEIRPVMNYRDCLQIQRRNTMPNIQLVTPCLWFDEQAEAATRFYTAVFSNSRIINITRYGEAGQEIHGKPAEAVMTVAFELYGQPFTALNGGSMFKFNEAISFQVICQAQEEVDDYWKKPSTGGDETGPAVRLAQGSIRRFLANYPQNSAGDAQ